MRVKLMGNRNKQSGFIEIVLIVSIAASLISYAFYSGKERTAEQNYQQQQIDNIKAGGVNDGRVDW